MNVKKKGYGPALLEISSHDSMETPEQLRLSSQSYTNLNILLWYKSISIFRNQVGMVY
jgi:hypothetical protein